MLKRTLSAIFAAVLFAVLGPLVYFALVGLPGSLMGFGLLILVSIGIGSAVGAAFPRVFGFIFDLFLDG